MGAEEFGTFVAAIPSPLGIGSVRLEDGSVVKGFLCESVAVEGAEDISEYGGWRASLAARHHAEPAPMNGVGGRLRMSGE
jgi:allophanate hydrolase